MIEPIALQSTLETVRFWAIVACLGLGVFFTLVSTVGVLRLPDIYARAHTASQTDTLGAGFALAGVALAFGWQHAAVYTVLLLFFVFITNPTAAHAIARSAAELDVEPVLAEDGGTDDTEVEAGTEGETR
ncbi:monovalent cation/proton antiporter, MnhG/PhaG subunit (plasmid) [Haloterrigena turkmenica DSM 5511]|uniref:Monovalent cation/proton antiporter, MnhG/PhaG subunit n=1 Tax=Haloterrigena turkmenica (strain ATCC 51198 / DSM 5511 / JCM 9101 / NCIMB 13204 / VKM B-1734 / 4k) TaxID=543526 RepID=D2S341_HALTV|nr:monovalent cation/H(+) antiporter subunit G [Haloterrigena turkmenica]ADB63788.1 monovalent cation/proton antiporter, MnhG/PhaG subunit [Haloterrigena turkmenica DSM 5511]